MRKIPSGLTVDDIHPGIVDIEKLSELFDLLRRYKIKSTAFVTPFVGGKNIDEDKEYVNLLKTYLEEGNEIGLHGSTHKKHEFGYSSILPIPFPSFQNQIIRLEKSVRYLEDLFDIKIYGFRAPDYEFSNITMRALNKLKFRYDSSKTLFKPTRIPKYGIRFRTFVPPRPHIVNGDLIEIPVTGDYNEPLDFNKINNDIEFVYRRNGFFIDNNHIHQISLKEKLLEALVNNNKLTKFYTLTDLIDIWENSKRCNNYEKS